MPRSITKRIGSSSSLEIISARVAEGEWPDNRIVIRKVRRKQADSLVKLGVAHYVFHPGLKKGKPLGVRMNALIPVDHISSSSLNSDSSLCVSGVGLKKKRHQSGRNLRRREEAEAAKVLVWPLEGDQRAVRVVPRISEEERKRAEAYLRSA